MTLSFWRILLAVWLILVGFTALIPALREIAVAVAVLGIIAGILLLLDR